MARPLRNLTACLGCAATIFVAATRAQQPPDGAASDADPSSDVHCGVLLLDSAPVLIRFEVMFAGQSLIEARSHYVRRLAAAIDHNEDGRFTPQEMAASPLLRRFQSSRAEAFLDSLDGPPDASMPSLLRTVRRVAGETVVYRQDNFASETNASFFDLLDEDQSGVIDRPEMASAASRLLQRDRDRDLCFGFDEI